MSQLPRKPMLSQQQRMNPSTTNTDTNATVSPTTPATPTTPNDNQPTASLTSTVQLSRPYLTRQQIQWAQNHTISNGTLFNQRRNQIFLLLLKIVTALKFPMRCLESAMVYYQRYYLHNNFDTQAYHDIGITALFITSKNEDTIKKLRDIILVANSVRNVVMNPEQADLYRKKILRLEFKLLETISFDFRSYHVEEYLVKIARDLKVDKDVGLLAWVVAIDSFQTDIALKVPVHSIALSCLIIASKLKRHDLKVRAETYHSDNNWVNESLLGLLDLYIDQFNFTSMAGFFPDLKDKFLEIKMFYAYARGFKDQDSHILEKDEYFEARDFSNGERRYMLGNQKKRLYNEI